MSDIPLKFAYSATKTVNLVIYIITVVFIVTQLGRTHNTYSLILISAISVVFCCVICLPSRHSFLYLRMLEGKDRQEQRLLCAAVGPKHTVGEYYLDDEHCYISPFGVFLRFVKHSETQKPSVEEQRRSHKLWIFLAVFSYVGNMIKKRVYTQELSIFIPKYQLDIKIYRKMCRILIWH